MEKRVRELLRSIKELEGNTKLEDEESDEISLYNDILIYIKENHERSESKQGVLVFSLKGLYLYLLKHGYTKGRQSIGEIVKRQLSARPKNWYNVEEKKQYRRQIISEKAYNDLRDRIEAQREAARDE